MAKIPKVILLVESSRASGRALLTGIASYANHYGPWSFYWEPGGLEKVWPVLRTMDASGIILRDVDKVEEALAYGIPTVFIGHYQTEIPGLVNVVTDSEAVGRTGAEHLMQCGFKHFAFCGYVKSPIEKAPWSETRREAFSESIHSAGFAPPAHYELAMDGQNWSDERLALARWLESLPKPVGLMACNDDCGGQVMEACKLAGLPVPDAVGVIGADNDELVCNITGPPMSSIGIHFERAGYEAAQALHGMMTGKPLVSRRITASISHVVARRSTDFVIAEEVHVARALRHIRDHARDPITVTDVARAAGLSRRALEKRFRHVLGRSILEEVRRVRTDQIARLLLETDLPVAEIAGLLGFEDIQHIARYFRAGKRMSPVAYRKIHSVRRLPSTRSQNGDFISQSGVVRSKRRRL